jgi:putative endonuclease
MPIQSNVLVAYYSVYILYSEKLNRYYVGSTELAVNDRLAQHNSPKFATDYTRKGQPWQLVLQLQCGTRLQAIRIERHIKAMKSSRYVMNLCTYPEMRNKLVARYAG